MTAHDITVMIGLATGAAGLLSGFAGGVWIVSAKNADLVSHSEAIKAINARCGEQRQQIMTDLERLICAGIKAAIKDLELEYKQGLNMTDRQVAVHEQRLCQIEDDVREIFTRINRRYDDKNEDERAHRRESDVRAGG